MQTKICLRFNCSQHITQTLLLRLGYIVTLFPLILSYIGMNKALKKYFQAI